MPERDETVVGDEGDVRLPREAQHITEDVPALQAPVHPAGPGGPVAESHVAVGVEPGTGRLRQLQELDKPLRGELRQDSIG